MRERCGLGINQLRERTGLGFNTISAIESGREVYPKSWRRYCEALGLDPLTLARELEAASS